jgi:hypothetical protein
MAALNWDNINDAPTPEMLGLSVTLNKRADETSPSTKQNVRSQVGVSWRWGGIDEDTMRFQSLYYKGSDIAIATAAASGISLKTLDVPVLAASTITVDNFSSSTATIKEGSHFMVWGDPVIYTVSEDSTIATHYIGLSAVDTGADRIGLNIDHVASHLYWCSQDDQKIYRCDLDGSNVTTVATSTGAINSMALDISNEYIYYSKDSDRDIYRMGFDGTGATSIKTTTVNITKLAFEGTYIFYTSDSSSKIGRLTISTLSETIIHSGLNSGLYGIAIDQTNNKVWWTINQPGTIATYGGDWYSNYDGSSVIHKIIGNLIKQMNSDAANLDEIYEIKGGTFSHINTISSSLNGPWDPGRMTGDFCVYDETVYYLTLSETRITDSDKGVEETTGCTLSITPNVTAETVALGDNADVYFFIPQAGSGTRLSRDGKLNAIEIDEEFVTEWEDVNQPEEI